MFGTAGLPHILMRFYTVPDARTARVSVAYATATIGTFYLLTFILGFGAMVLVGQPAIRAVDAGGNMAAPLLAEAVGGQAFLGFISAVAFATILAVVAGLDAGGRRGAVARHLRARVPRRPRQREGRAEGGARRDDPAGGLLDRARHRLQGPERRLHGRAGVCHCRQRQLPGAGAVDVLETDSRPAARRPRSCSGTVATLVLIYLSPTIQIDLLKHTTAYFPYRNPGLFTIPLSFIVGIVTSLVAPEPAAVEGFAKLEHQIHVGEEEPV